VKADCSLFVSDEEWERVQSEKREKHLEIARLEARLAQSKVELLEAEARERSFARRDLAVLKELERARDQVEGDSGPGTAAVETPLSEPLADLGCYRLILLLTSCPSLILCWIHSCLLSSIVPRGSISLLWMPLVEFLYQFLAVREILF
jgi:hypothetical protein